MSDALKTPVSTPSGPAAKTEDPPSVFSRLAIPVVAVFAALAAVSYSTVSWNKWTANAAVQTTDDAYVAADVSMLSARVSGNITALGISDYQKVSVGDLIAEIDPREYQAAVELAVANLAAAKASRENLANQELLQSAVIDAAQAQLSSARAVERRAQEEFDRQQSLGDATTVQLLQQAQAALLESKAAVVSGLAAIEQQKAQLSVLKGQEPLLDAQVAAQQANVETAKLHQEFSRIYAPISGTAGKKAVQLGNYVSVGTEVASIVPLQDVYVTANYKETQLAHLRPGQSATVSVDTLPGIEFKGIVTRISPASGSVFALLPPDNATGNFTKVVQRLAIRVELDKDQSQLDRLRPGMSATVSISARKRQ